jgi:hypothetical protein
MLQKKEEASVASQCVLLSFGLNAMRRIANATGQRQTAQWR